MSLSTPKRRPRGVSLVEVLITLLLTGLAMGLLSAIFSTQSRVTREQESLNRFLVNSNTFLSSLRKEIASAYALEDTEGDTFLRVGFLLAPEDAGLPPRGITVIDEEPLPTPQRGAYHQVRYWQSGESIRREDPGYSVEFDNFPLSASSDEEFTLQAPESDRIVLEGVQAAQATLTGSRLDIRIAIKSQSRLKVLESVIFCPGLTQ